MTSAHHDMMESIRKWFYRPKRDDTSLLAQFFYADESLNAVACELDSFDGRQEPERCTTLVNQLRHCQDKVLTICNQIMDDLIPESRANRDFRVKFPDDVMQENLAGQLWFGAECLAAGSSILNREDESSAMRPLAKALTKSLEIVRNLLREHALKGHMNLKTQNPLEPSLEKLIESLKIFDRLFADFELCYVGAMVPVKSTKEYEQQELVCVLFSETLQRALKRGLLNQIDVDNYEPALMFTIPRLAIVSGLLAPPGGPLCLNSPDTISEMFKPFRTLLLKIRELLWTLNNHELYILEKLLCSNEELSGSITQSTKSTCQDIPDMEEYVHNFYTGYPNCKEFIVDFYTVIRNTGSNMEEVASDAVQCLDESNKSDQLTKKKCEKTKEGYNKTNSMETESKDLATSSDRYDSVVMCENCDTMQQLSDRESVNEQVQYEQELSNGSHNSRHFSNDCDFISNDKNNTNESFDSIMQTDIKLDVAGSSGALNSMEDMQNEESFITPEMTQMLKTCPHTKIRFRYLLNQVTHEIVHGETGRISENSLPDLDSEKLISEANKSLSNLLLESQCQNEISEQTDSGICTVISSENTSLYDKSPEEKKTFANEIQQEERCASDEESRHENTSYSCSNMSSPKKQNSVITENTCVCSTRSINKAIVPTLEHSVEVPDLQSNSGESTSKNVTQISSNFDGTNEEFIGVTYGNGQLTICDSVQSTFQINYSENWENLNLNIDASGSRKEFWNDLKCENCPSTSQSFDKIGSKREQCMQDRMTTKTPCAQKRKDEKQRKRHVHKLDRNAHKNHQSKLGDKKQNLHIMENTSVENSRSNSTDRYLNSRLTNLGTDLHFGQNTRQMPTFGSYSPHMSPRLHHFKTRSTSGSRQHYCNLGAHYANKNLSPQSRKLLNHRRSKSEQIAKIKRKDFEKRERYERDKYKRSDQARRKISNESSTDLINDGLGPRIDMSGLAIEASVSVITTQNNHEFQSTKDNNSQRSTRAMRLVNASTVSGITQCMNSNQSAAYKSDVTPSSSCSSCCDSSSETSEFHSDCQDDEEIALAMQAAEIANRNQIRAKFRSSEDLVHRLFVCIAGVADQLQTNFASDLRNILKCVFLMNSSQAMDDIEGSKNDNSTSKTQSTSNTVETRNINERQEPLPVYETNIEESTLIHDRTSLVTERGEECVERAPAWVPDNNAPRCMACQAGFTVVRRRHHCRNCGKVFCGRCSSNNVPLPRYGHIKPVRVCNRCFLFQVTPFTVSQVTSTS